MIEIVSHEELQFGALKGVHTGDIYRFTIPLIVLSTLVVALRVYVRGFLTRTFSLSEWLILPAYVGSQILEKTKTCTDNPGIVLDLMHLSHSGRHMVVQQGCFGKVP